MRNVYRVLAYLVAAGVVAQAGAIAYAVFGLSSWVEGGGTLDKAVLESGSANFSGEGGFAFHGIGGGIVIPLIALLLLIASFFAKVPGGVKWALYVFASVVVQVALGLFAHSISGLGILHGVVALGLFAVAFMAGHRVRISPAQAAQVEPVAAVK